jgi:DNA-binding NarL/FixJ family response regulator
VLVADTITMSCHLLADALQRNEGYHASAAATPIAALQALERERFDVVLVGIGISDHPLDSVRFLRRIAGNYPAMNLVILLDAPDPTIVVEAFRAGARGIFCRSDSFESLRKCIRCVCDGQVWAKSEELQFVLEAVEAHGSQTSRSLGSRPLSKREEQITTLVAEGYSNRQISERLGLSEHTIKNYLFRVFEKLGVSTRVGLTLYALRRGGTSRVKPHSVRRPPAAVSQMARSRPSDTSN